MGLLRFLLALSVLLAHAGPFFGFDLIGGKLAVQVFFMVSGFYMSLILSEKYVGINGSYFFFISNRLLRVFPAYLLVLLLSIAVSLTAGLISEGGNLALLESFRIGSQKLHVSVIFFLSNILIVGQDILLFTEFDALRGVLYWSKELDQSAIPVYSFLLVPQAWSLSIELMFYFLAPYLVKCRTAGIAAAAVLSFFLRLWIFYVLELTADPWTYRFFPTEMLFFLMGILAYRFYVKIYRFPLKRWVYYGLVLVLVIYMIGFKFLPSDLSVPKPFQNKELGFFILAFISLPFLFLAGKDFKWDRRIGELSYPIYISHYLVIAVYKNFFPNGKSYTIPIIISTLIFSWIVNKMVSDRLERFRQSRVIEQPAPVCGKFIE